MRSITSQTRRACPLSFSPPGSRHAAAFRPWSIFGDLAQASTGCREAAPAVLNGTPLLTGALFGSGRREIAAEVSWDLPSLAPGATALLDVTVNGARAGDLAQASLVSSTRFVGHGNAGPGWASTGEARRSRAGGSDPARCRVRQPAPRRSHRRSHAPPTSPRSRGAAATADRAGKPRPAQAARGRARVPRPRRDTLRGAPRPQTRPRHEAEPLRPAAAHPPHRRRHGRRTDRLGRPNARENQRAAGDRLHPPQHLHRRRRQRNVVRPPLLGPLTPDGPQRLGAVEGELAPGRVRGLGMAHPGQRDQPQALRPRAAMVGQRLPELRQVSRRKAPVMDDLPHRPRLRERVPQHRPRRRVLQRSVPMTHRLCPIDRKRQQQANLRSALRCLEPDRLQPVHDRLDVQGRQRQGTDRALRIQHPGEALVRLEGGRPPSGRLRLDVFGDAIEQRAPRAAVPGRGLASRASGPVPQREWSAPAPPVRAPGRGSRTGSRPGRATARPRPRPGPCISAARTATRARSLQARARRRRRGDRLEGIRPPSRSVCSASEA